jgi:high affinity Mn2+ porin
MSVLFSKWLGVYRYCSHSLRLGTVLLLCLLCGAVLRAQDDAGGSDSSDPKDTSASVAADDFAQTTMFPHGEWSHFWLSGQANFISQWHPAFYSPYQGKNSLTPQAQDATSRVLTLFTGWRPTNSSEVIFDVQETGGDGLSEALGAAGFFNLDVVRNPYLSKAPYVARLMLHHVFALGSKKIVAERNPFSLFPELPERRLEVRFGKMSIVDFFDANSYGSDSNLQFMNWTIDNNGAYDYAADTRGFTYAAELEYHDGNFAIRFAEALMPKVANGIHLDADLARARAENVEFEIRRQVLRRQTSILRLLSFVNHANMGDYGQQIDGWLTTHSTPVPEITDHPLQTTVKYGFGVNVEQPLNNWFGVFGRWGWNEGQHESYAYTEADQTWEAGVGGTGARWNRSLDRFGVALVSNGISRDHAQYLGYGGLGFLLGDGKLDYGRETTIESYYTLHLWRGIYPAIDVQHMNNPGYNRDRGPVLVTSLRLHLEF